MKTLWRCATPNCELHAGHDGDHGRFFRAIGEAEQERPLDLELERLRKIEHAARDVDGLWSEGRTLIRWEVEAGEALDDLRTALAKPLIHDEPVKETSA